MAKKRSLDVAHTELPSIDDLLNESDYITLPSPITQKSMKFKVFTFSGDDILQKTNVHKRNQRIQKYLTEKSLAPIINSIKDVGQVTPALGKLNSDGSITVIYGSRRRLSTFYAKKSYTILACDDISDEEAQEISKAENISESISLIERGEVWLAITNKEGLTSREIAEQIENKKVSHSIISAGIAGAKLPDEIKGLYPSVSLLGRPTIMKLANACKNKSTKDIIHHVTSEYQSILDKIWLAFNDNNDLNLAKYTKLLTSIICDYSTTSVDTISVIRSKLKTNEVWSDSTKVMMTEGKLDYIVFDKKLNESQLDKLKLLIQSF